MIILAILGIGIVAGWLAHIIVEGGRSNNWGFDLLAPYIPFNDGTVNAGFVGSFIGGLLSSLLAGDGFSIRPSGIIGSVIGAVIFLLIYRAVTSRRAASVQPHHKSGDPRKH